MPTVVTYIKTSDLAKYLAIKEHGTGAWAEFIHNALNGVVFADKEYTVTETKPTKTPKDAEKAQELMNTAINLKIGSMKPRPTVVCKIHGTPLDSRGKCLQKGCKYA